MALLEARARRIDPAVHWTPVLPSEYHGPGRAPKAPKYIGGTASRLKKASRQDMLIIGKGYGRNLARRLLDRLADHPSRWGLRCGRLLACFALARPVLYVRRRSIRGRTRAIHGGGIIPFHGRLAARLLLESDIQHSNVSGQVSLAHLPATEMNQKGLT